MKKVFIFLVAICFKLMAFAGTESSGGGPSVFCPNATIPEGVAQLYDFFEGRLRYGLNVPITNNLSKEAQVEIALKKLEAIDYGVAQDVKAEYANILKQIKYIPDGIFMSPVTDLGNAEAPLVPVGCQLIYSGFFEQSGQLSISRTVFDRFSETEKAGLLLHEAIYALARDASNQSNSRSTRILNSFLFSNTTQANEITREALTTLNPYDKKKAIVHVIKNNHDQSVVLKARCNVSSSDDSLQWGASAALWSSRLGDSGTYQGAEEPRLSVNQNMPAHIEMSLSFYTETRLISFENVMTHASGNCINTNLEIFYAGNKVGSLPMKSQDFLMRLY